MAAVLSTERRGAVAVLRLDRPPSNALNLALLSGLKAEVEAAVGDTSVRAIVVTSALPKYFSSGLDLDEMLGLEHERRAALFHGLIGLHRALAASPKPTVAAVAGSAILGGFIVTLACDYRVMGETAKVSLSEIKVGLSPTTALIQLLCRLCGSPALARAMVLEGRFIRAEEALAAGLVDAAHPAEAVEAEALRLAERLSRLPPAAYAATKQAYRRALMGDEDALWAASLREFEAVFASGEAREGLAAAKEKRKPRWEAA